MYVTSANKMQRPNDAYQTKGFLLPDKTHHGGSGWFPKHRCSVTICEIHVKLINASCFIIVPLVVFMHVPTKTHEYTYPLGLSHETRMGNAQKCINKFETCPKPQNSQIQRGLKMFHPHNRDNIGLGVPIASIRCRQWRLFRHCAQGMFVLKSNELGNGTTKSSALWNFKKFNLWQVSQDYTKAWKCPLKTIFFRPLKVKYIP